MFFKITLASGKEIVMASYSVAGCYQYMTDNYPDDEVINVERIK